MVVWPATFSCYATGYRPSLPGIFPCYGKSNYVENFLNFVTLQMTLSAKGQGGIHPYLYPILDFIIPSKNLSINIEMPI